MSKNRIIETEFRDWDLLIEALKRLGIPHEIGHDLQMYGYEGNLRPEKADLVVRRRHVGLAANDLGFVRRGDRVDMVISEYDMTGPGARLAKRIKQEYALAFVERQAKRVGARVKSERRADGTIVVRVGR